jgi:hypothetical protein
LLARPTALLMKRMLDIHIILNTIHAPSIFNSPASSSWIPVCLPKFNPSGFVNAYISFLRKGNGKGVQQEADVTTEATENSELQQAQAGPVGKGLNPGIALVCISGGGDFDTIRGWCDDVTKSSFLIISCQCSSHYLQLLPRD